MVELDIMVKTSKTETEFFFPPKKCQGLSVTMSLSTDISTNKPLKEHYSIQCYSILASKTRLFSNPCSSSCSLKLDCLTVISALKIRLRLEGSGLVISRNNDNDMIVKLQKKKQALNVQPENKIVSSSLFKLMLSCFELHFVREAKSSSEFLLLLTRQP